MVLFAETSIIQMDMQYETLTYTHTHTRTKTHTYVAGKKAFIRNWLGLAESSWDGEGRRR